jgi:hypothetical protein
MAYPPTNTVMMTMVMPRMMHAMTRKRKKTRTSLTMAMETKWSEACAAASVL